ncbi:MAG: radical SAM protein [Thermofilaceae archaeon]
MKLVKEINVIKKSYRRGRLEVAVAYPSVYEAAARSLSVQMLYFYLNSFDEISAERFVLRKLRGAEPPAVSLESGRPLRDFRLIVFSVHYEPDYVNIVRLLLAGGVDPLAEKREHVVVVGGPPVIANPEPLSRIADVLVVGEIESTMPILVEQAVTYAGDKRAFLDSLKPEQGFYVPSRGDEQVSFNYPAELPLEFHPAAQFQPENGEWRRTTIIEVARGCSRRCRFCMEGHIFTPQRDRPLEQIVQLAEKGSRFNGSNQLTLVALSLFDHREADRILETLIESGYKISLPSLRIDTLTRERIELLAKSGQKTLVLAPETANVGLSLVLGKPLLEERLLEATREARRAGFKSLKLYFMVGLPGEGDVRAIANLVKRISEHSGFRGERELKLSVSVFVPKPQTPMQWFGMEDPRTVRRKLEALVSALGGIADVRPYKPAWAYVQCVLSRGGSELTDVLIEWALRGGGLHGWREAARGNGLDTDAYTRPLDPGAEVPWAKVRLRYPREYLERSYLLCMKQISELG